MNDKENSQSFLQTFNGSNETATNALYQYLKSKHLNKDAQKRPSNEHLGMSKNPSRAYIDINELKNMESKQGPMMSTGKVTKP